MRINRAMLLVATTALLVAGNAVAGPQQVSQLLEEIKSIPPGGRTGEWTIGKLKLRANAATQFDFDSPAKVGALAGVAYVMRDGEAIALGIAPQRVKATDISDGPYVFWKDKTTAEVVTFEKGELKRVLHKDIRQPKTVTGLALPESSVLLDPELPATEPSSWEMPERLLAISDLEGNYENAAKFLQANKVIDANKKWAWGKGHLVLVGDLVDRGSEVTELMRLLRRLAREAKKTGGHVHYVLGNHELMVMGGDDRYAHPKYNFIAGRVGVAHAALYGPNTDIGRWWRTRNSAVKIGSYLFVHAGYSPFMEQQKRTLDNLNKAVRSVLPTPTKPVPSGSFVGDMRGPLWFRGYFPTHAARFGGLVTKTQLAETLARHKVEHIVVGHTVVPSVGKLSHLPGVIGIDTEWRKAGKGEGLLITVAGAAVVNSRGDRRPLKTVKVN